MVPEDSGKKKKKNKNKSDKPTVETNKRKYDLPSGGRKGRGQLVAAAGGLLRLPSLLSTNAEGVLLALSNFIALLWRQKGIKWTGTKRCGHRVWGLRALFFCCASLHKHCFCLPLMLTK